MIPPAKRGGKDRMAAPAPFQNRFVIPLRIVSRRLAVQESYFRYLADGGSVIRSGRSSVQYRCLREKAKGDVLLDLSVVELKL